MSVGFTGVRDRLWAFARQELGAATVDWVLLCSGATVMGLVALNMGQQSVGSYSATVRNEVQSPYFQTNWTSALDIPPQEDWPDQPAIIPVSAVDETQGVLDEIFDVLTPPAEPECDATAGACTIYQPGTAQPTVNDPLAPSDPTPSTPAAPPAPVVVVNGDFADETGLGWTRWGNGVIDLYLGFLAFNSRDSSPGGTVSQTVVTQVGQAYVLSVSAGEYGANAGDHNLTLSILDAAGVTIATRTDLVRNASSQTFSLPFVATTQRLMLRFSNPWSSATNGTDLTIDNVTITPS